MAVQPSADIYGLFPTGLHHYCTEYNSIKPRTAISNVSIISVHSTSHPLLPFKSLGLSFFHHLSFQLQEIEHYLNSFETLSYIVHIKFWLGFVGELAFAQVLYRPFFFFYFRDIYTSVSISQTVSFWYVKVIGSVCPGVNPLGMCSSVNGSLCFQTRCFVGYDKSVDYLSSSSAEQWARGSWGDNRATSHRQLRALITESSGYRRASLGTTDMEYF